MVVPLDWKEKLAELVKKSDFIKLKGRAGYALGWRNSSRKWVYGYSSRDRELDDEHFTEYLIMVCRRNGDAVSGYVGQRNHNSKYVGTAYIKRIIEGYPKVEKPKQTRRPRDKPKAATKTAMKAVRKSVAAGTVKAGHVNRLGVWQQTKAGSSKAADQRQKAMRPGYRVSQNGNLYFERRSNRSDTPKELRAFTTTKRGSGRKPSNLDKNLPVKIQITSPPKSSRGDYPTTFYAPKKDTKLNRKQLMAALMKQMKRIHKCDVEHGIIMDSYGNLLGESVGTYCETTVPLEAIKTYNDGREFISLHNHPGDERGGWVGRPPTPFSDQDIKTNIGHKIPYVAVATYAGIYYLIEVLDWDLLDLNDVLKMYRKVLSTARNKASGRADVKEQYEKYLVFKTEQPVEVIKENTKKYTAYLHVAMCEEIFKAAEESFAKYHNGLALKITKGEIK